MHTFCETKLVNLYTVSIAIQAPFEICNDYYNSIPKLMVLVFLEEI